MKRKLNINGDIREFDVDDDTPLLWVLRDTLGLTGTKYACGVMACGSCTVLVDGNPMRTCAMPVNAFNEQQKITTIEGLNGGVTTPVQKAWAEHNVPQCGFCQSGMILATTALLEKNPNPSDDDIGEAITNLCRCGCYQLVRSAIKQAAKEIRNA